MANKKRYKRRRPQKMGTNLREYWKKRREQERALKIQLEQDPIFHETNETKLKFENALDRSLKADIKVEDTTIDGLDDSNQTEVIILKQVRCRCCLKVIPNLLSKCITDQIEVDGQSIMLKDAVFDATGIPIEMVGNEGISFCPTCVEAVKSAYQLKLNLRKSFLYLNGLTEEEQQDNDFVDDFQASDDDSEICSETNAPHLCEHCGLEFPPDELAKLKRHVAHYHYKIRQLCEYCGEEFELGHLFRAHIKSHTVRRQCEICGKVFKRNYMLQNHMDRHLNIKRVECPDCDEKFFNRDQLLKHSAKHTGVELFSCDICSKSFYKRWSLNGHMRLHTGEKPYKCKICNKGFTHNVSLKTHVRKGCYLEAYLKDVKKQKNRVEDEVYSADTDDEESCENEKVKDCKENEEDECMKLEKTENIC